MDQEAAKSTRFCFVLYLIKSLGCNVEIVDTLASVYPALFINDLIYRLKEETKASLAALPAKFCQEKIRAQTSVCRFGSLDNLGGSKSKWKCGLISDGSTLGLFSRFSQKFFVCLSAKQSPLSGHLLRGAICTKDGQHGRWTINHNTCKFSLGSPLSLAILSQQTIAVIKESIERIDPRKDSVLDQVFF